ncbi:MAG: two-component system response regulator CreB [Candidatus Riflebacteria bacterium]|nr:two-component system response regulator CreB [Candidatus Riflebacteria bacterium]
MTQTILLVEDEPSIAENISYALSTEGFAPRWCRTAGEAREALASTDVALIVLDVGLPDANGFELAREIRQAHDVPIIFVTARSSEIDRVVGLEIGADDYVVKPFSPRELTARVKAVLRRVKPGTRAVEPGPAGPRPGRQPAMPFTLDEARCRITCAGRPLELTRYEYRLLAALIRSPGQVFSRGQLMELAWEEPDVSLERTIDTHMKTIRQKLRAIDPGADPIQTHRGMGYSLKEKS